MLLTKFSYRFTDVDQFQVNPFILEPLCFGKSNLLVGRNASGKTTAINSISTLASLLSSSTLFIGNWEVEWFEEESQTNYRYSYKRIISPHTIIEKLWEEDKVLFERLNDIGKIFSNEINNYENINPPIDKHILNVRRDQKQYPYLEKIAKWAEGVHSFKFGHIHAPPYIPDESDNRGLPSIKDKNFSKIIDDLDETLKPQIIEDFNQLGYDIQLLNIRKEAENNVLFIKENHLKYEIRNSALSQGMFRSLSILIFIHYLIKKEDSKLIIIDDLCEGLDFDRATRLGKILFKRMEENDIQFIATSNDSFLMNVVDIKYWNIIHREKEVIKSYNYRNNRVKFEEFKNTGLNNFDLFASNYLSSDE